MKNVKRKYSYIPDTNDIRDKMYSSPVFYHDLPPMVDLRPAMPPVYDQGRIGSCVANATGACHEYNQMKQKQTYFAPSRLFIYWGARKIEHSEHYDAGCMIRDAIKVLVAQGVCEEKEWPYVESRYATRPSDACFRHAMDHQAVLYQRLFNVVDDMRGCLASGFPFAVGLTIYESFESKQVAKTGMVPFPSKGERSKGGHAVTCVGYDNKDFTFIMRNSWGANWGMDGYFKIPFSYMTSKLASDIWTIRQVEG